VGSLIGLFVWAIGTTYYLISYVQVQPLERQKTELELRLKNNEQATKRLSVKLAALARSYSLLEKDQERPILESPRDGASLVGEQVTLSWKCRDQRAGKDYILELRNLAGNRTRSYSVINPEQQTMHFSIREGEFGEYLWRIQPGKLIKGARIVMGPPSQFSYFSVHPSVSERVRETGVLRVGTSPTFTGHFNTQMDGTLVGFDVDLIHWLASKFPERLDYPKPPKVEFIDLVWGDLLPSLRDHEVDVVSSAMTSTAAREEKHRGVRFTHGYFTTHQILISRLPQEPFPDVLKGRKVGVAKGTTNEGAARHVADRFGFEVVAHYNSYADIYAALSVDEIDFGIVDDVLVLDRLGRQFVQVGPPLDEHLKGFYRERLGRSVEQFAIAVVEERPPESSLLATINDLLESEEGQRKLAELNDRWIPQAGE
jgi:ABC-type amino acid transport substrate-binding protein